MEEESKNIPLGWDYNPSAWSQRIPIVLLALGGFFVAMYLALYQYQIIEDVFEPFFGDGSRRILDSELSRILPISDAALGAMAYLADAISGIIGGKKRWQTMPWMVVIFGFLVGPLGLISVGLVIAQPLLYDAWCTLCLLSALVSVIMIGPSMDEVLACLQYLKRVRERKKHSVWRIFWGLERDDDPLSGIKQKVERSVVWPRLIATALGLWLIIAPALLHYGGMAQKNNYIIGPLVFTFGLISIWDVSRSMRLANVPLALWLLIAPWFLDYPISAMINSLVTGALLLIFSLKRDQIYHHMENGWPGIFTRQRMFS